MIFWTEMEAAPVLGLAEAHSDGEQKTFPHLRTVVEAGRESTGSQSTDIRDTSGSQEMTYQNPHDTKNKHTGLLVTCFS